MCVCVYMVICIYVCVWSEAMWSSEIKKVHNTRYQHFTWKLFLRVGIFHSPSQSSEHTNSTSTNETLVCILVTKGSVLKFKLSLSGLYRWGMKIRIFNELLNLWAPFSIARLEFYSPWRAELSRWCLKRKDSCTSICLSEIRHHNARPMTQRTMDSYRNTFP